MGVESNERVGRMLEGMRILRRLWSEEKVTHEGRFYQFQDLDALPKPAQARIPIWLAVNPKGDVKPELLDRVLKRVAKYSDGWQTDAITAEDFRERFDRIKAYATEMGRDADVLDSSLHLMVNIHDDRDTAYRQAHDFLVGYYGSAFMRPGLIDLWVAYGRPENVAEKIQSYVDAGCTTPVLRFVGPDMTEQVGRYVEEVVPLLDKR